MTWTQAWMDTETFQINQSPKAVFQYETSSKHVRRTTFSTELSEDLTLASILTKGEDEIVSVALLDSTVCTIDGCDIWVEIENGYGMAILSIEEDQFIVGVCGEDADLFTPEINKRLLEVLTGSKEESETITRMIAFLKGEIAVAGSDASN